jgi:uncharacterized protein (DUF1015 family)
MAIIKPFKGIRPTAEKVHEIACRPYDVLNEKEALIETGGRSHSITITMRQKFTSKENQTLKLCLKEASSTKMLLNVTISMH